MALALAPASASSRPVLDVVVHDHCPAWGFTLSRRPAEHGHRASRSTGVASELSFGSGTNQDGYSDLFVGGIPESISRLGQVRYITVTVTWAGGPTLRDTLRYCVPDPETLSDCSRATYAFFGFPKQWQCVLFVVRAQICARLAKHGHTPEFCARSD